MTATRDRAALTAGLLALAAGAWAITAGRMASMDMGTGSGLGWFMPTWLAMMAAMMLPPLVPAALAVTRIPEFVAGYLTVWAVAGLAAYPFVSALHHAPAAVLLVAAGYQLTPVKAECLRRCRSPRGQGIGSGLRHGAYCVGCCAGPMAALFALGWMSLGWMAVVAVLVAAERLLPWPAGAVRGVATALVVLALTSLA